MGCGGSKKGDAASNPSSAGGQAKKSDGSDKKAAAGGARGSNALTDDGSGKKTVMGSYEMNMTKEDLMGEGTSSICRKGVNLKTGEMVGIKVYKKQGTGKSKEAAVTMQKFKRQIEVLKELMEPLVKPNDPTLWCDQLAKAHPSSLFMQLVDYSKDEKTQEPAPDKTDDTIYVITELAQYSLKDYLSLRREQCRPLSRTSIQNISKAICLVMAGLHAKGLVHIDMKPENVMMFNARLKLIDVDGCVKIGTSVSIHDSSISFSPCYCAPEWARFLIEEDDSRIVVQPGLDVWSIGMTLCELVTLDAILKPMYANFLRSGHSHREAGFLFMEWLSSIKAPPLPKAVERFDPAFVSLIKDQLLVCDTKTRKNLAQCMSCQYIVGAENEKKKEGTSDNTIEMEAGSSAPQRKIRTRGEDQSNKPPIYQGTLWKLNTEGDPNENTHWLKRDMWIAANGSFCYYSLKEDKRLVYMDQGKLARAETTDIAKSCKPFAFELKIPAKDDKAPEVGRFACETEAEFKAWKEGIAGIATLEVLPSTMKFDADMIKDLRAFRLAVKNRRKVIPENEKAKFEPEFKAVLWKVKQDGDRMLEPDWFEREMWISKNGSLVYYSKKEEKNLVYYTTQDLEKATIVKVDKSKSFREFTFQVCLAPHDGIEFMPGEFAAVSAESQDRWIQEFGKLRQE